MKRLVVAALCTLFVGIAIAFAQTNTGANHTVHVTGTLPVTNNLALAANESRKGCVIQNQSSHNMSIATNSAMNDPLVLPAEQNGVPSAFYCNNVGIVIGDSLYITGTAGDTYVLWWQ